MTDYRIEAASKEEWAERALRAEAKLALRTGEADAKTTIIKELEAKLVKAVCALIAVEEASAFYAKHVDFETVTYSHESTRQLCSTVLAELKGDAK